jgi:methionyl-tRNA formyltransferase
MINIILCGYREWAFHIFDRISSHPKVNIIKTITSNQQFIETIDQVDSNKIDLILFVGWSWIIKNDVTKKFLCLGIHPSDLPQFRGGSPLQHQIIQGVTTSMITLMTLSAEKIDAGDIWLKEELDLTGDSMQHIFNNMILSSVKLLNKFFNTYPNIKPYPQKVTDGSYFKRRVSEESRLTRDDFVNKPLEELYNFIRCLTDPYPNAYLEDAEGNKLVFKNVIYIPKREN